MTTLLQAAKQGLEDVVQQHLSLPSVELNAKDDDGYTAVHYAAKFNHIKVLKLLLKANADAELKTTCDNNLDNSPLHLACINGFVGVAKVLIAAKCNIEERNASQWTPLHCAASGGFDELVSLLIGAEADVDPSDPKAAKQGLEDVVQQHLSLPSLELNAKDDDGYTAVHYAAKFNHIQILKLLLKANADAELKTTRDNNLDNSPLHLACINGFVGVAKVLIAAKCNIEERNASQWTPLHCAASGGFDELVSLLIGAEADVGPSDPKVTPLLLAARFGHVKVVQLLLNAKANVTHTDKNGSNALDLAIDNGHEAIAMAIINSEKWDEALRNTTGDTKTEGNNTCCTKCGGNTTTPLRKLIRKMPEVAKVVLNKCIVTKNEGEFQPDSEDYLVLFNYEFLEDFRDKESTTCANSLTLKCCSIPLGAEGEVIANTSEPLSQLPNAGKIDKLHARKGRRFTTNWGPMEFTKANHLLSIIVNSGQTDLLNHPVVYSLLQQKWRSYGCAVYWGNLFVYLLFLMFLTAFALTVPNPETESCKSVLNGTTSNSTEQGTILQDKCDTDAYREWIVIVAAITSLILSGIRLFIEVVQIFILGVWRYLRHWVNWIELTLFTFSIIFVTVFFNDCYCATRWQWQMGTIAVLLGWLNLFLFLRKLLPLTGLYVIMFIDILYTFCHLFLFALLLVIAFGLAFHMAFSNPHLRRTPFSTPALTLLNIMSMTTGEFDYNGIFRLAPTETHETYAEIPFPTVSYILWILFIILMPILLTNMLIGLAVDNIKGTLNRARVKRRAWRVDLVLNVEEVLPSSLRRFFIVGSYPFYPNRCLSLWERFVFIVWGRQKFDSSENINETLHPPLTPVEQQTHKLLREMDDMRQRNQRLENMLSAIIQYHKIPVEDESKPFIQ